MNTSVSSTSGNAVSCTETMLQHPWLCTLYGQKSSHEKPMRGFLCRLYTIAGRGENRDMLLGILMHRLVLLVRMLSE